MGEVKRTDEIQGDILHEYDGIEEADNALPNWWLLTFYGAIIFSIGYWFYYHEYHMGPTTPERYAADVAERAASGEADEQTLLTLATDTGTVAEGQETFSTTCAACHGAEAEGNIGPNLTDGAWLHGGGPMQIYNSIKHGISAEQARLPGSAGMPEWGPVIGEQRTQAVTAFLLSIRDTNVQGGRDPEGEPYDPDAAPTEEASGEEAPDEGAAELTDDEPTGDEPTDDATEDTTGEEEPEGAAAETADDAPADEASDGEASDGEASDGEASDGASAEQADGDDSTDV